MPAISGNCRCLVFTLVVAAAVGTAASEASAQGFRQAEPIPSQETKSLTAIERLFNPPVPPALTLFPQFRDRIRDTPAFIRDSKIGINARSYYRDQVSNASNGVALTEAWAAGGWTTIETGRLFGAISGGAVFYTSLPLYAPAGSGNSGLLLPDQQGYAVLGQLYGQIHLSDKLSITAGRHVYDTPFLNGQDNRMTPNTFYGYALQGTFGEPDKGPSLRYGGGYIATMKPRDSDAFTSMSRVAGASVDRGVVVVGSLLTWGQASIGAVEYYSQDIINIVYGEGNYGVSLSLGIDAALACSTPTSAAPAAIC